MLGFGVRLLEVLAWWAADVGRLLGEASDLCVSKNCKCAVQRVPELVYVVSVFASKELTSSVCWVALSQM